MAAPARSSRASSPRAATSWMPIGRPVGPRRRGQGQRRQAEQGPGAAEERVARGGEAGRRLAVHGRRDQHVAAREGRRRARRRVRARTPGRRDGASGIRMPAAISACSGAPRRARCCAYSQTRAGRGLEGASRLLHRRRVPSNSAGSVASVDRQCHRREALHTLLDARRRRHRPASTRRAAQADARRPRRRRDRRRVVEQTPRQRARRRRRCARSTPNVSSEGENGMTPVRLTRPRSACSRPRRRRRRAGSPSRRSACRSPAAPCSRPRRRPNRSTSRPACARGYAGCAVLPGGNTRTRSSPSCPSRCAPASRSAATHAASAAGRCPA